MVELIDNMHGSLGMPKLCGNGSVNWFLECNGGSCFGMPKDISTRSCYLNVSMHDFI